MGELTDEQIIDLVKPFEVSKNVSYNQGLIQGAKLLRDKLLVNEYNSTILTAEQILSERGLGWVDMNNEAVWKIVVEIIQSLLPQSIEKCTCGLTLHVKKYCKICDNDN